MGPVYEVSYPCMQTGSGCERREDRGLKQRDLNRQGMSVEKEALSGETGEYEKALEAVGCRIPADRVSSAKVCRDGSTYPFHFLGPADVESLLSFVQFLFSTIKPRRGWWALVPTKPMLASGFFERRKRGQRGTTYTSSNNLWRDTRAKETMEPCQRFSLSPPFDFGLRLGIE